MGGSLSLQWDGHGRQVFLGPEQVPMEDAPKLQASSKTARKSWGKEPSSLVTLKSLHHPE